MATRFENRNSLFNFVVREGNGIKGLVDSGLLKVPDQFLQPPHERMDKLDLTNQHIPQPIDLSELDGPNHDQVVESLTNAAQTFGFFQVVNHGVPVKLLQRLKDAAHRFFNQPPEKKTVYLRGLSQSPFVMYGTSFTPEKEKALEWRDFVTLIYSNDADALQHWPNECNEVVLEYLRTSTKMATRLLEVLLGKLGVTIDDQMVDAYTSTRVVNLNFYPTCPNPELTVGISRHSDVGTLTVLLQDGIGGLYIKVENDKDAGKEGEWIEIAPVPGALVINVGDTLEILSNGRYKSAEHRVRTTSIQNRVSIPLFLSPRITEKIRPLPQVVEKDGVTHYREFLYEEYKNNYFGNPHEGKKSLDFAKITMS